MKLVNTHKLRMAILFFGLSVMSPAGAQTWSLEQCIDTALVNNDLIAAGRIDISRLEEKAREVVSKKRPQVNLKGDYHYYMDLPYQFMPQSAFGGPDGQFKSIQMGVPHNIYLGLDASVVVYNPTLHGATATAATGIELGELQLKQTREEVVTMVTNLYYNAQIMQHKIGFLDGNLANLHQVLATTRLLYSQDMVKHSDVMRVELQLMQLTTSRRQAREQLDQVINSLLMVMGNRQNEALQVEKIITPEPETSYVGRVPVQLEMASVRQRLLRTELRTLRMEVLPTVSLYGSYAQTGFGYDETPNEFLDFYPVGVVGIQMKVPLFTGLAHHHQRVGKELELEAGALRSSWLSDQHNLNIKNAYSQRATAMQILNDTEKQIALAQQAWDEITISHREGTAGLTDVLLADNALREADQRYLEAVVSYLKADMDLRSQTGNLLGNQ